MLSTPIIGLVLFCNIEVAFSPPLRHLIHRKWITSVISESGVDALIDAFKTQTVATTRSRIPARTQTPFTSADTAVPVMASCGLDRLCPNRRWPNFLNPKNLLNLRDLNLHPRDLNPPSGPQTRGPTLRGWGPTLRGPNLRPPPFGARPGAPSAGRPSAGPPKISFFFCLVSQQFSFLSSLSWGSSH